MKSCQYDKSFFLCIEWLNKRDNVIFMKVELLTKGIQNLFDLRQQHREVLQKLIGKYLLERLRQNEQGQETGEQQLVDVSDGLAARGERNSESHV